MPTGSPPSTPTSMLSARLHAKNQTIANPATTIVISTPLVNQRPPHMGPPQVGINAIATRDTTETDARASQMSTNVQKELTNVRLTTPNVLTPRPGTPVNVLMGMLEMDTFARFHLTNVQKELMNVTCMPNALIYQMATNANVMLQRDIMETVKSATVQLTNVLMGLTHVTPTPPVPTPTPVSPVTVHPDGLEMDTTVGHH